MKKLLLICGTIIGTFVVFSSVFSFSQINGNSMSVTIPNHSLVLFNKLYFNPKRGDIMLYEHKTGNIDFVGRIVALPTESVRIQNEFVYIQNKKDMYRLEEEYVEKNTPTQATDEMEWVPLNDNQYLVLGDQRKNPISIHDSIVNKNKVKGVFLFKF